LTLHGFTDVGGDESQIFGDYRKADKVLPEFLEKGGNVLVHPALMGKNLKEAAAPAFEAVSKATPAGTWVKYQWQGAE
jgi:hypothetical protein